MSEITKMLLAVGLLAAGFFSASLFGTPDSSETKRQSGEWSPQPLEPVDNRALVPSSASALWDANVAPASHVDDSLDAERSTDTATVHQAARPAWLDQTLQPLPDTSNSIPEIRSQPQSTTSKAPSRRTSWPEAPQSSSDDAAKLSPPSLLSADRAASPMRPSRFPDRPADTSRIASAFPPAPDQGTGASTPAGAAPSLPAFDEWNSTAPPRFPPASAASTPPSEPVWHVVADGDSLPKIAERYLRDASRAQEIYNLNRDVLTSPDLLPIGTELRIPQTTPSPPEFEVYDVRDGRASSYDPQSRLVPLPELPASLRAVPRARLQRPVNASFAGTD